jgi:hypothetical protein
MQQQQIQQIQMKEYKWSFGEKPERSFSQQIQQYKEMGFEMNNQNCQIEHLKQILFNLPCNNWMNILPEKDKYSKFLCFLLDQSFKNLFGKP